MKTVRSLPVSQSSAGPTGLSALAASQGMAAPVSVKQLLRLLSFATFEADVTTPDPESLGGTVKLTIRGDGAYELKVHMHDSGAPDYSFRIAIFLRSTDSQLFALYSRGTVRGSDYAVLHPTATGYREFDDTQTDRADAVRDSWDAFAAGTVEVHREWSNNMEEWAESLIREKLFFVLEASTIGAPAALILWGTGLLDDLADIHLPGELGLVGLVAAEGQYFLAGPGFFLPVFIAGALVSAALFKRRRLHSEETAELRKVFQETIAYDRIWITNLEAFGSRPFTLFVPGGEIMVAAASSVFPDSDNLLANKVSKRTLVHEFTHAWQYQHKPTLANICEIVETREEEIVFGENAVYDYKPGLDWGDGYNMEQKAQIVGDWYSAKFNQYFAEGTRHPISRTAEHDNDRYIQENIRSA